jgi:hypothetical protein
LIIINGTVQTATIVIISLFIIFFFVEARSDGFGGNRNLPLLNIMYVLLLR